VPITPTLPLRVWRTARLRAGFDDAITGISKSLAQRIQRNRGGTVAGNHEHLDALVGKKLGILERVAPHGVGRLAAVWEAAVSPR